MPLVNPVQLFQDSPQSFDAFLRALSTIHSSGVLELLRERGQVKPVSQNSTNYVAAQAAAANWSLGYNQALDDLIYFREIFMNANTTTPPPLDFGSLERAVESGDLTEDEANAIRRNEPIPLLKQHPIPDYAAKPGDGPASSG